MIFPYGLERIGDNFCHYLSSELKTLKLDIEINAWYPLLINLKINLILQ